MGISTLKQFQRTEPIHMVRSAKLQNHQQPDTWEGERVKRLRAKFQGDRQEFPQVSNKPVSQLAALLAKEETHALKPGSENVPRSAILPRPRRIGLTNVPLPQDEVPGLGLLCEEPAKAANSKDGNAVESSLHPAFLHTEIREAPCKQEGAQSNSNLPQRSKNWPLIKNASNQGVSAGAPLVPTKGTSVLFLLDTPGCVSEKQHPKVPKKKPLPHTSMLGLKPMKPQRPPVVDLEKFHKAATSQGCPAAEPVRGVQRVRFAPQAAPAPRIPSLKGDPEEIYDDVEAVGPIGKGKGLPLSPPSWLPAQPRTGSGGDADLTLDKFPPQPAELRKPHVSELQGKSAKNLKQCRKEEKADKEFQKKFKFEGEIHVLTRMMVDPNVTEKKGGGKNLPLKRGEILDVIQLTSHQKILCRNNQWKYGYVPRAALLQLDSDIYDDVAFCD